MGVCCIPCCRRRSDGREADRKVSFHRFPADEINREKWIARIKNEFGVEFKTQVTAATRVCSKHFKKSSYESSWNGERRKLRSKVVPTKFKSCKEKRSPPRMKYSCRIAALQNASNPSEERIVFLERGKNFTGVSVQSSQSVLKRSADNDGKGPALQNHTALAPMPAPVYTINKGNPMNVCTSKKKKRHKSLLHGVADGQVEVQQAKESARHDHNYDQSVEDKLRISEAGVQALQIYCQQLTGKLFFLERFSNDSESIHFYTGFCDYATFKNAFCTLYPSGSPCNTFRWTQVQVSYCQGESKVQGDSLPLIDQFFMFMCYVRQGFCMLDLGVRFGVPSATVHDVLLTWTHYLYLVLSTLDIWPSRECVDTNMPACFKETYPDTRVILESVEIRVQVPGSDSRQLYLKDSSTTFKGLLGMSPFGAVTFVSDLYLGDISDCDIAKTCGILNRLQDYDVAMAHESFLPQEASDDKNATIVVPPFLRPSSRRDVLDEADEIAQLEMLVRHALQNIEDFHVFDTVIPSGLAKSANQLWTVCALFCNFNKCHL